jgi:hypothetical protein
MPYIKPDLRPEFEKHIVELNPETAGDLNYIISRIAVEYVLKKGKKYTVLNEVLGVFSAVAHEFYRRVVAPYEDEKKKENGDIKGFGST